MATYYLDMVGEANESRDFAWCVNKFGQIMVSRIEGPEPILLGKSFVMCDGSTEDLQDFMCGILKNTGFDVVWPEPWWFGKRTWQEVVEALNSEKSSRAKTCWRHLRNVTQKVPIRWYEGKWALTEKEGDGG